MNLHPGNSTLIFLTLVCSVVAVGLAGLWIIWREDDVWKTAVLFLLFAILLAQG